MQRGWGSGRVSGADHQHRPEPSGYEQELRAEGDG